MGKVDFRKLSGKERKKLQADLKSTIESMKEKGDLVEFFNDLLTESEAVMIARRVCIAKFLLAGVPQAAICGKLHVGLPTVHRVDKWLRSRGDDYRSVFPKLYSEVMESHRKGEPFPDPHSFRNVRKRYPLHFLIFNLLLEDL